MRFGLLSIALMLASGCTSRLDPYGHGSLCDNLHPELSTAIHHAVSYWNGAGLYRLQVCGAGSISVEVMPQEPTDENDSIGTEYNGLPQTITVAPSVVSAAIAGDSWAAEVLAHELGHAFGLDHVGDDGSVMWHRVHALPSAPEELDLQLANELLGL